MDISNSYKGREHSLIKHQLLEAYLEKMLFIIATSGFCREIVYVDCFAGPWGDDAQDMQGTSIAISLNILSKVKQALTDHPQKHIINFKAIYVEKANDSYKRLSSYLDGRDNGGIETKHIHGDFTQVQNQILDKCSRDSFAFFFIDPKGWTDIGISTLKPILERPFSECLINFMYDFYNRFVFLPAFETQRPNFLGHLSDQELDEIRALSGHPRELYIVKKYRAQLIKHMPSNRQPRSYHATILDKDKNRTKYHLVYLSGSPKGIIEFAKGTEKAEFTQRLVREQVKRNKTTQGYLFSLEDDMTMKEYGSVQLEGVKEYWLTQLSDIPTRFGNSKLATMLEETGWFTSDLQTAFKELLDDGRVENIDARRKRTKHHVHFEKSEHLRRIS